MLSVAWMTSNCTASRVVTTSVSYVTHGDTTTTIVTKMIETYQGKKGCCSPSFCMISL